MTTYRNSKAKESEMELEPIKKRLESFYRANKAKLTKVERKYLDTPTQDLRDEVMKAQGALIGIKKAAEVIENRMADPQIPIEGL